MIIYRKNDKVEVNIEGIDFKISPLTYQEKSELQGHMIKAVNGDMNEAMDSVRKSLKFCLKEMRGVFYLDENSNKQEYSLQFDENKQLTDDCVNELLNMSISNKLNSVCSAMLGGVPNKIVDVDGNEIEGIKIKKREEKKQGKSKK